MKSLFLPNMTNSSIPASSNRFSHTENPRFRGYFAAPLDTLYLESKGKANKDLGLLAVANQLKVIGDEEGFRIGIQVGEEIHYDLDKLTDSESDSNYWGQDGKLILQTGRGEKVIAPALYRSNHQKVEDRKQNDLEALLKFANPTLPHSAPQEAGHDHGKEFVHAFAKALQLPLKKTQSEWDGGNVFLGKNTAQKPFALIGADVLENTARCILAAKSQGLQLKAKEEMLEHPELAELKTEPFLNEARRKVAQDFGIRPNNLFVVSQPNFHIDMAIRPLKYPTVLVNDFGLSLKLLKEIAHQLEQEPAKTAPRKSGPVTFGALLAWQPFTPLEFVRDLIEDTEHNQRLLESQYANTDQICKELEDQGFEPIRVPGLFNSKATNFMNAIVHERPDGGLVYITNKSPIPKLNEVFENYLKDHAPSVKSVHFIDGISNTEPEDKDYNRYHNKNYPPESLPFRRIANYIAVFLQKLEGGIHCMVTERLK